MDLLVLRAVSTAVTEQSQYIAGSPWYICNVVCSLVQKSNQLIVRLLHWLKCCSQRLPYLPVLFPAPGSRRWKHCCCFLCVGVCYFHQTLSPDMTSMALTIEEFASGLLVLSGCSQATFLVEQRASMWPHPLSEFSELHWCVPTWSVMSMMLQHGQIFVLSMSSSSSSSSSSSLSSTTTTTTTTTTDL